MSLIEIPICPAGDPTGTPVETLTEADISAIRIEVSLNDLGEVRVTLPRVRWEALGLDMRESYYGRVQIPYIDNVGYVQGFWLVAGEMVLVSEDERGGEDITIGGPGPAWILNTAVLNHEEWTDHSGVYVQDGKWYWSGKNYGQILSDLVNEDAASNHPALDQMETPGWDNANDVDGNPWPQFGGEFAQDVGTTFLEVIRQLQRGGELEVWVNPNLNIRAYSGAYGRNLSGTSYGTGVVRFVGSSVTPDENRNIIGKLTREKDSAGELTHVLVLGNDRRLESGAIVEGSPIHKWVTSPDYVSGDKVHEGFLSYDTNSRVILERAGQRYIQRTQDRSARMVQTEVMPGQDENNGLYLPGAPSSDRGNYWIGDTVTWKTGGVEGIDLFNRDLRLARIRIDLDVAASDASDQTRELSWRTFVETGDDATPSASAASSLNEGRNGRGEICNCPVLCSEPQINAPVLEDAAVDAGVTPDNPTFDVAGADRLVLGILISDCDTMPNATATYGPNGSGVTAMTKIADVVTGANLSITAWGIWNPAPSTAPGSSLIAFDSGSGKTGCPSPTRFGLYSAVVGNLDTNPLASITWDSAGPANGSPASSTATAGLGDLVLAAMWAATNTTFTATGTDQTIAHQNGENDKAHAALSEQPGAASVTSSFTWTPSGAGTNDWIMGQLIIPGEATSGDGHPDLIGTSNRVSRCGHSHIVMESGSPGTGDDEDEGFHVGDGWLDTATDTLYILSDATSGAAVWHEIAAGIVTDHGSLSGLADDDHPQYLTTAEHDALSHEELGHWEVIVSGTAPPVAVSNPDDDDWLYGWVPD